MIALTDTFSKIVVTVKATLFNNTCCFLETTITKVHFEVFSNNPDIRLKYLGAWCSSSLANSGLSVWNFLVLQVLAWVFSGHSGFLP